MSRATGLRQGPSNISLTPGRSSAASSSLPYASNRSGSSYNTSLPTVSSGYGARKASSGYAETYSSNGHSPTGASGRSSSAVPAGAAGGMRTGSTGRVRATVDNYPSKASFSHAAPSSLASRLPLSAFPNGHNGHGSEARSNGAPMPSGLSSAAEDAGWRPHSRRLAANSMVWNQGVPFVDLDAPPPTHRHQQQSHQSSLGLSRSPADAGPSPLQSRYSSFRSIDAAPPTLLPTSTAHQLQNLSLGTQDKPSGASSSNVKHSNGTSGACARVITPITFVPITLLCLYFVTAPGRGVLHLLHMESACHCLSMQSYLLCFQRFLSNSFPIPCPCHRSAP